MSEVDLERVLDKLEETEKSKGPLPPFCKEWNWGKGVIDEQPHHETIHKYWVKVSLERITQKNLISRLIIVLSDKCAVSYMDFSNEQLEFILYLITSNKRQIIREVLASLDFQQFKFVRESS